MRDWPIFLILVVVLGSILFFGVRCDMRMREECEAKTCERGVARMTAKEGCLCVEVPR